MVIGKSGACRTSAGTCLFDSLLLMAALICDTVESCNGFPPTVLRKRITRSSPSHFCPTATVSKRFSDRFIPNSINKSLINEFSISCGALDTSTLSNNKESGRSRKSDAIYNKILESELINDQTPSKNNF